MQLKGEKDAKILDLLNHRGISTCLLCKIDDKKASHI